MRWPEASPTNHSEASARFRRLHELRESEMTVTPLDFRETYVEILPSTWVVCSLSIDEERDDLVLSRLRKGKDPMIVRMPLRRQANRDNGNEDCLGYKGVIAELADILASSDATLQQASQPLDRNGRVEWWNTRKVLDERLGSLLGQIETTWLGAFKVRAQKSLLDLSSNELTVKYLSSPCFFPIFPFRKRPQLSSRNAWNRLCARLCAEPRQALPDP